MSTDFVLPAFFQAITEMYSMPNGEQEQALEGEASGGDSGEWTSDGEGDGGSDDSSDGEEVESPVAGRGDPSLTKNDRVPATRQLLRLVSLRSVLGSLHQPRLRRRQSTPKLQSRGLGRRCRRSRLISPLPPRECLSLYSLDAPRCLFFLF